jgi:hypothetical protein
LKSRFIGFRAIRLPMAPICAPLPNSSISSTAHRILEAVKQRGLSLSSPTHSIRGAAEIRLVLFDHGSGRLGLLIVPVKP